MFSTCSTSLPSIPTNLGVTPFPSGPALIFIPVEVFSRFCSCNRDDHFADYSFCKLTPLNNLPEV